MEIKDAILALPEDQFAKFSSWFDEYEEQHWDGQLDHDQKSGPLRDLMNKALVDFKWPFYPARESVSVAIAPPEG